MPSQPLLRPGVLVAKERMAQGRDKLRSQHQEGSPGFQVCARQTDLVDGVVLDLFSAALHDLHGSSAEEFQRNIALIAHGGYGRRDLAPYSDVDLMLLYREGHQRRITSLARRLTQDICDVGLQLGFSPRTPKDACRLAVRDPIIFTSLVESRYLSGSVGLFRRYMSRLRKTTRFRSRSIVAAIDQSRRSERIKFGDTVHLLRPNVKKSRGGLRDIQMVRWVGFARYGECDLRNLYQAGILSKHDRNRLREAQEFLLRLRNELHFNFDRAEDVLERSEQLRLAEKYEYKGAEGVLPVEQFMREYFDHVSEVRYISAQFVKTAMGRSNWDRAIQPLLSHQVEGDFLVGPRYINATRRGLTKLCGDLAEILRLMDLASLYDKRIGHETWQAIRHSMSREAEIELSPEAIRRFLSLLAQPTRLGEMLRRLHELRVLERIIPAMKHARSLLQFNDYHKYTVDEHSLQAVQRAAGFFADKGSLGRAYRSLKSMRTLHLALLIHDLGKGFPEDHSEVGLRLADETAQILMLPEQEAETLKFLVHKHLMMSHLAFRRNIDDESIVVQFAVEVGTPEVLQMLYVLTCADLDAVGPGVLNQWKKNLLGELYHRTRRHLTGSDTIFDQELIRRRAAIREFVRGRDTEPWWDELVDELPASYLQTTQPEQALEELKALHKAFSSDQAAAWGRFLPERNAVQYTVGAHESIAPGIFHRLTGALTAMGQQILGAEINTLPGSLVLDRFFVNDLNVSGAPSEERLKEVSDGMKDALAHPNDEPPRFGNRWQSREVYDAPLEFRLLPARVRVDNNTSETQSIIDIFAHDRIGLLYAIARALFELDLSVSVAKIGTYLDQVVDVFYVTDSRGQKIQDDRRISEIREKLLDAIEICESSETPTQST